MTRNSRFTTLRRTALSLFLAFVACGMSFYVILFGALMLFYLNHPVNPPDSPEVRTILRYIALPISAVSAVVVFVLSYVRLGRREKTELKREQGSNKAAA